VRRFISVTLKSPEEGGTYFENSMMLEADIDKLYKPVDKTGGMSPQR
jgi:hypothetical protein